MLKLAGNPQQHRIKLNYLRCLSILAASESLYDEGSFVRRRSRPTAATTYAFHTRVGGGTHSCTEERGRECVDSPLNSVEVFAQHTRVQFKNGNRMFILKHTVIYLGADVFPWSLHTCLPSFCPHLLRTYMLHCVSWPSSCAPDPTDRTSSRPTKGGKTAT